MKVILKDNVDNLGSFGDVVKVAPGHARNYLIPRGLAVQASRGNLNQMEAEKAAWAKKALKLKEDAERVRSDVESLTLTFRRKAGDEEGQKLFGSVTSMDIEAALKEKGLNIEKKNILLNEPLKHLGESTVSIKLHPEVKAGLKVLVEREEAEETEEKE